MGQQIRRQDQMTHCGGQLFAGDLGVADRLSFDLFGVKRTKAPASARNIRIGAAHPARAARIGEPIPHLTAAVGVQSACRLYQQLAARQIDQFLRDRHRQADGPADLRHLIKVHPEHRLDQDVAHHGHGQQHRIQTARGGWSRNSGCLHVHCSAYPLKVWVSDDRGLVARIQPIMAKS